jgi:hypothetical protein
VFDKESVSTIGHRHYALGSVDYLSCKGEPNNGKLIVGRWSMQVARWRKTWKKMGLGGRTSAAGYDSSKSEVVYMAALGHLRLGAEAGGVYKTSDGGRAGRKS